MNLDELETKYNKQAFELRDKENNDFLLACEMARAKEAPTLFKYYTTWKQQAEEKKEMENEAIRTGNILRTGFNELDYNIKIFGKRLMFILGRSGCGKTSLMAQWIRRQLLDGKSTLVFSCEEAGEDFITRIALNSELEDKMVTQFTMCDKGTITIEDIKLSVLKMDIMGIPPDAVYIDQLNKIKPEEGFKGNKHERIVHVSEQLQDLVKIINRPVIILHQCNRATEANEGFSTQANVADADAVFNEAQVMMFIESHDYQEWAKTKEPYREIFKTYINVGKNRSVGGWVGAQYCWFNRSTGMFLTDEEYQEKLGIEQYTSL